MCVCVGVRVPVKARIYRIKGLWTKNFDNDKAPHSFVWRLYKIKCIG